MTTPRGRGRRVRQSDITQRTNRLHAEGIPLDVIQSQGLATHSITTKKAQRFRNRFAKDLSNAELAGIDRDRAIQMAANVTNRAQRIVLDRRFKLVRQGFTEAEIRRSKLDQISFRNRGVKQLRAQRQADIREALRDRGLSFEEARAQVVRGTREEQRARGIPFRAILDLIYPPGSSRFEQAESA